MRRPERSPIEGKLTFAVTFRSCFAVVARPSGREMEPVPGRFGSMPHREYRASGKYGDAIGVGKIQEEASAHRPAGEPRLAHPVRAFGAATINNAVRAWKTSSNAL